MSDYAERLNEANKQLRFTNIKGKEYAEVNQRILAFWSLFPTGRIVTRKTHDDGQRCEFECRVYRDAGDEAPATTGHAYEVKQGSINSTSYVENCETSAIGRALGLLGIGATTAIASADEVLNAMAQQDAARGTQQKRQAPATGRRDSERKRRFEGIAEMKAQAIGNGVKEEGIGEWFEANFGDAPLNRLTDAQLTQVEHYLRTIVRDSAEQKAKREGNEAGGEVGNDVG